MSNPQYPSVLPCFEATPYNYSQINTIQRTQFASGRTRARRRFAVAPVTFSISAKMTTVELGIWESWRYHTLKDVGWFDAQLITGNDMESWTVRLISNDQKPERLGGDMWQVNYEVEAVQQKYMPQTDMEQFIEAGDADFGIKTQAAELLHQNILNNIYTGAA